MEVKKLPFSGCLQFILGIFTVGVFPLVVWLSERNWPKSMDEQCLVTRGGRRIDWTDFNKITKVVTQVNRGSAGIEKYELQYPQGKVDVVVYRLEQGQQVLEYIWKRLPDQIKQ